MEVEKCFKKLLIKNPFYGLFALSLPKNITRKYKTLCVTKDGINLCLNINPDFWEEHTDEEQLSLLQHELSHIALQHIFMSDSFADSKLFNISADAEINSYIENLPSDAVTAEKLGKMINKNLCTGMGTKKYYEELQNFINKQQANAQSPQMPCNGGKGGQSSQSSSSSQSSAENPPSSSSPSEATQGDTPKENKDDNTPNKPESPQKNDSTEKEQGQKEKSSQNPAKGQQERGEDNGEDISEEQYPDYFENVFSQMDDHSTWKDLERVPEATKQLIQNNIGNIIKATAEQVTKMRGTIPGELTEIIEKLNKKKPEVFNWKAYFRRMLGSIYDINIRSTRRKESKRFAGSAGIQHKKKVSILVAVDTSGSVSQKELQEFFSEIDYVYKAGARVTIVQCDTRINGVSEYDGKNIPEIRGRGGTSFDPPVDYYVEHRQEYASMIYFTDGEAPMPRKNPSNVIWVISSNGMHQDYPGKTIYIPPCNNND